MLSVVCSANVEADECGRVGEGSLVLNVGVEGGDLAGEGGVQGELVTDLRSEIINKNYYT